jgi:hypothetical protein
VDLISQNIFIEKIKDIRRRKNMAKGREIQCLHYICEHQCDLGKDAVFRKLCQTCSGYKKKPGAKPRRTDTRKQKLERIMRKEKY